jgi:hypothetical protein
MEYEVQLDITIWFDFTLTSLTLYMFRVCVARPQEWLLHDKAVGITTNARCVVERPVGQLSQLLHSAM